MPLEQVLLGDDEDVDSECELAASFKGTSRKELLKKMAADPEHLLLHEPKNPFCILVSKGEGSEKAAYSFETAR